MICFLLYLENYCSNLFFYRSIFAKKKSFFVIIMNLRTEQLFYLLFFSSIILTQIPYLGKFFRVINTMIHEFGHASMALILKGEVVKINLFSDTSGNALTKVNGKLSIFLVSISGYPFSSIIAFLIFYLISNSFIILSIIIFMGFGLISLILFVRNSYGIIWLLFFLIASGIILQQNTLRILYFWSVFNGSLLLIDSVISSFVLLKISIQNPNGAGDAYNLKKITHLPVWFWAFFFTSINVYIAYLTILISFPAIKNIFIF